MQDPAPAVPDAPTTNEQSTENAPAEQTQQPQPSQTEQPVEANPTSPTLTKEQIDEYNSYKSYIESHGGFDKLKKQVDARAEQLQKMAEQVAPQPTSQPTPQPSAQQTSQPLTPPQPPKGYVSAQDMLVAQYYQGLARDPKYAPIAKEIADGDVLTEMAEFGIYPTDQNGFINDAQVRKFLDLKVQTVPAQQTSVEPSTTPTADYVNVGETITTLDEAQKVLLQNETLRASGQAEHPSTAKAKEFLANYLKTDHRVR